jgi:rubrerythrin
MSRESTKSTTHAGVRKRIADAKRLSAGKAARVATRATEKAKKKPAARKPAAIAGKVAAKSAGHPRTNAPRTLAEFMAQALAMEREAAQRYSDLADAMEMHNNREVAALFRKMAGIERKHAARIMVEMGWKDMPMPALPTGKPSWEGFEAPETTPDDEVHYLMQPYHALQLALVNEQRAERFFAQLARAATVESVSAAARELQAEEREHVKLVRAWMKKLPKPDRYWANDPDPASYTD